MYDADYENYRQELKEEYEQEFVLKHGDEMSHHSDGVVRDTTKGKVKFPLVFPKGVAKKDQLFWRVAMLYTTGGERYGDRNWENSEGEDTLAHHEEALWRHFMSFYFEEDTEEDHAAAIVWNINAVELTRRKIREAAARNKDMLLGRETAGHSADLDLLYDLAEKYGFELVDKNDPPHVHEDNGTVEGCPGCFSEPVRREPNYDPLDFTKGEYSGLSSSPVPQMPGPWQPVPVHSVPKLATEGIPVDKIYHNNFVQKTAYEVEWRDGDTVELAPGNYWLEKIPGKNNVRWVYRDSDKKWHFTSSVIEGDIVRSTKYLLEEFAPVKVVEGHLKGLTFDTSGKWAWHHGD